MPERSIEEENLTQPAAQPFGPDLSTHPVFQSLIGQGYVMITQWPEVAAALMLLPPGVTVADAITQLPSRYPEISYVQPDPIVEIHENRSVPSDNYFPYQWYFDQAGGN